MRAWSAAVLAAHAGAELVGGIGPDDGPERVSIDSRDVGPGVLFVGLPGERTHGGRYLQAALDAGAWGVLSDADHIGALTGSAARPGRAARLGAVDPLAALQALATAWRRDLGSAGAKVIAVTGSTGKTSTKDILGALLTGQRAVAVSARNFNTEIGLPLQLLAAPAGTEVIVLEMGMRARGQIAELAAIAEPDVGIIVSIGPVHLELLGSIEAIAAAKAELIAGLAPGATAIIPAGERLLDPHRRDDLDTVTFGPGGAVTLVGSTPDGVVIDHRGERIELALNFTQAHLRRNLLAAVAAVRAVGAAPAARVELALSPGRGQRIELTDGITLLDDAYNANPMSMRAALDELATVAAGGGERPRRRLAVLGDMLELGPGELVFHREVGAYADGRADVLVCVGLRAAAMADAFAGEVHRVADADAATALLRDLLEPGDVVLVKASNGIRLDRVAQALVAA